MYLYNSLSHKKELFTPNSSDVVKMYTCGPTVYHFAHIGNLRTYIMEDVLEKALRYEGYPVKRVMNITDVGHLASDADTGEDKMLKGAKREHKSVMEIAKYYTDAFFADCDKLNIKRPDVVQPATGCIPEFINMVSGLLDKGFAYVAGGNVYFDTSKLEKYYVFNDHNEDDLAVGVREGVEEDPNKRNKNDFVLWFTKSKFEDQALKWDSPWGVGYPGWHIECSAMARRYLGKTIDIHCGGQDLIFPHHENEIAQSEALTGKRFAKYWTHNGLIKVNGQKMSKSLGNSLLLEDLLKQYSNEAVKFALLSTGYRGDINITDSLFPEAEAHLRRFYELIARAEEAFPDEKGGEESVDKRFDEAMSDDFNTALALSDLFGYFKEVSRLLAERDPRARRIVNQIRATYSLLGLFKKDAKQYLAAYGEKQEEVPEEVKAVAEERKAARANKDWAKSDELREKLKALGYAVKDSKDGYTLTKL